MLGRLGDQAMLILRAHRLAHETDERHEKRGIRGLAQQIHPGGQPKRTSSTPGDASNARNGLSVH